MNVDKAIYNRWKEIGVLQTLDKDGNNCTMSFKQGASLAMQFEQALTILTEMKDDKGKYIDVFAIIRRMFEKQIDIDVKELVDKFIRWRNSRKYSVLYSDMLPFEPEWKLNILFVEHYDDIDGFIDGTKKISVEPDWK